MFKNIDKIFCICLKSYPERKKEFEHRFPQLVGSDIFEWYETEKDTENPKRGCHNSHKIINEVSKERGYSQIITFEDDANLLVPWDTFVKKVNEIKYPDFWKAIQLGYLPLNTSKIRYNNTLVQINCSALMHCYISNIETLDIPEYNNIEVDALLFCPSFKNYVLNESVSGMFGIYPHMLVRQNSDISTIDSVRNGQGNMEYNRSSLIEISTLMNYTFFLGILLVFIIVVIIVGIIYLNK